MSLPRRHEPLRVLVLQHDRYGGLGAYERVLAQRKAEAEVVQLNSSRRLPDWRTFDAIMALGRQASIAAGSPPVWLPDERQYVREAVVSGARNSAGVRMHTGSSSISRSRRRWPMAGLRRLLRRLRRM
jgi:hypothetical protein